MCKIDYVLVVSSSIKFNDHISSLLPESQYHVCFVSSRESARLIVSEHPFAYVIINAPLYDNSCVSFATRIAHISGAIVLMLTPPLDQQTQDLLEEKGILTLEKPISKRFLKIGIDWMRSFKNHHRETEEKLKDLRQITQAKCLLIENKRMSEEEAHHYIEQYAMNLCITKAEAATAIINTYHKRQV